MLSFLQNGLHGDLVTVKINLKIQGALIEIYGLESFKILVKSLCHFERTRATCDFCHFELLPGLKICLNVGPTIIYQRSRALVG